MDGFWFVLYGIVEFTDSKIIVLLQASLEKYMPRDNIHSIKPTLYYPTIIISDLHLGKRKVVEAGLLLEFLEHIDCDTLILNGDIIDGWYLEKYKQSPVPEMHARIMDSINHKAAKGTKVIYLPGNHDERLRYYSRQEMDKMRLFREKPQFSREIIFHDKRAGLSCPFLFRSDMILEDQTGRRMQVLHGDIFDPPWIENKWAKVGDQFYDGLVIANTAFSNLLKKFNGGTRFSFAKLLKKNTKDAVGIIKNFELAASQLPDDIDGMICGHIHHAEIAENNGKLYVNSGDWIESCTAAVHDKNGEWKIIHWEDERMALGLEEVESENHPNPNALFRPITKKQLLLARYFWPAADKKPKEIDLGRTRPKEDKILETV